MILYQMMVFFDMKSVEYGNDDVLQDWGVYFNPEQDQDIAVAVEQLINNLSLRQSVAKRAKALSEQYSWEQCADRTWAFLVHTYARRNETR